MAFTPTKDIFRRIEAALEWDLLGTTTADADVHDDANGSLDPLNSSPVAEAVERYAVDPIIFGDYYAKTQGSGIGVGYSFNTQQPDDAPRSGAGSSLTHTLPVEITIIAVLDGARSLIGSDRAEQVDDVMDDVMTCLQAARRDAPNFLVQTVELRGAQKLDAAEDQPYMGRLLRFDFRRSHKALQVG